MIPDSGSVSQLSCFFSVSSPTCSQNVNLHRCHSRLQLSNIFQGVPLSFAVEDVDHARDLEVWT